MKISSSIGIFLINSSRAIIGETIDGCRFFSSHRSCDREKKKNETEGTTFRVAARNTFDTRLEIMEITRTTTFAPYIQPSRVK